MSKTPGPSPEELPSPSLQSKKSLPITSICSVFTEIEDLCFINEGESPPDITTGINQAMARRIKSLDARIGTK